MLCFGFSFFFPYCSSCLANCFFCLYLPKLLFFSALLLKKQILKFLFENVFSYFVYFLGLGFYYFLVFEDGGLDWSFFSGQLWARLLFFLTSW
ncbi:MAG: hypothetical protein MRERV_63c006 [Mycoplasmataceae bacterium RV_VA103A]|nr:MAG: hypothetical protein MRERV_63c006 [Mycoplasmataceae bacterium RV_VA103A]